VTHSGCGALCPSYSRGCFGCFGPLPGANVASLSLQLAATGVSNRDVTRLYRTFNANSELFRDAAQASERQDR
jgi:sulfhydrogenase subunit delta